MTGIEWVERHGGQAHTGAWVGFVILIQNHPILGVISFIFPIGMSFLRSSEIASRFEVELAEHEMPDCGLSKVTGVFR